MQQTLVYRWPFSSQQEVTIDSTVTEFKLTRLHPMSKYTVQLQGERGGSYTAAISTEFTTGKWSNIFDFIKKLNKTSKAQFHKVRLSL